MINDVKGFIYFPNAFNPYTSDNMSPEQVNQMIEDNALIALLEPWLVGTRNHVLFAVPFKRAVYQHPSNGTTMTRTINQANASAVLGGIRMRLTNLLSLE
jgi:hypothetical protein